MQISFQQFTGALQQNGTFVWKQAAWRKIQAPPVETKIKILEKSWEMCDNNGHSSIIYKYNLEALQNNGIGKAWRVEGRV